MLQAERQRSKDMGQELQVLYIQQTMLAYLRRPSGEFRKKNKTSTSVSLHVVFQGTKDTPNM